MIKLTQTATWNSELTNGYRTRYTTYGKRFYKVYAESLNGIWYVDEIDKNGKYINSVGLAFTLAEARTMIYIQPV